MSKLIGEITVKFDGEDRTFKVRRIPYSHQARLFAMIKSMGAKEDGSMDMDSDKIVKLADFQIDLCSLALAADDGSRAFKKEEIDEWGMDNVRAITVALDAFNSGSKTTVDHSGNS